MDRPVIRVWGPYQDGPAKYRLKLFEGGHARSLCFKTAAEAEAVKAKLRDDAISRATSARYSGTVVMERCRAIIHGIRREGSAGRASRGTGE